MPERKMLYPLFVILWAIVWVILTFVIFALAQNGHPIGFWDGMVIGGTSIAQSIVFFLIGWLGFRQTWRKNVLASLLMCVIVAVMTVVVIVILIAAATGNID